MLRIWGEASSDLSSFCGMFIEWMNRELLSIIVLRPDLFLLNESARIAVVLELTCPWDGNILRSHEFKREKYAPLVNDLSREFNVFYFPIEVSVRGQISKGNRARFKAFIFRCCTDPRKTLPTILRVCSRASLLGSFSLFCARKEPSWTSPTLLTVRWFAVFIHWFAYVIFFSLLLISLFLFVNVAATFSVIIYNICTVQWSV